MEEQVERETPYPFSQRGNKVIWYPAFAITAGLILIVVIAL